ITLKIRKILKTVMVMKTVKNVKLVIVFVVKAVFVQAFCEHCVEHDVSRSRARREWFHYHPDEPCPEIELPQPGPRGA
ncbi:MAG: hypothetical protein AAF479_17950, partial [Pseudomonadota bacterium]